MIEGFFSEKQIKSTSRPDGKILSCVSCGLYKKCKSPKMEVFGDFKKKILNIGEAPGRVEDLKGKPWQGETGELLRRTYADVGIDLFKDCLNVNAVLCRPTDEEGSNRTPTNYEVDCCRRTIMKVIEEYNPNVIVLFGGIAVYSLLKYRWKKDLGGISKWRGWIIPDKDFDAWVCPTFHPSFVSRGDKEVMTIWKQDLRRIEEMIEVPLPEYNKPNIEIIEDLSVLDSLKTDRIAFDYETTGLKPHASGHRIICASVADSENHAYSFMMPKSRKERMPFIRLLQNENIKKMAHNMKFEQTWSLIKLRQSVFGWDWDSMLAAHILDNRPGITGLKFQAYVNFGIVDYDSAISSYLQGVGDNGGNNLNQVQKLVETKKGKRQLLTYCGFDSIYEYRLAMKQMSVIYDLPF